MIIKVIKKYLPYLLLAVPVLFNGLTMLPELSIKNDPNDNIFHYALTYRTNEVVQSSFSSFSIIHFPLSISHILDHWDPYWASGYPLSYYYQHLPQLIVITVNLLLLKTISLYQTFNLVKYLLWVFWPVSLYFSARKFGFKKLTSALTALFASQMLTNGLYGVDISSFAWRGYGITTQLYALFFAPLALGQIYDSLKNNRRYWLAVLFLSLTFACHLAIGYLIIVAGIFIPLALLDNNHKQVKSEKLKVKSYSSKLKIENSNILKLIENCPDFQSWTHGLENRSKLKIVNLYLRLVLVYLSTFLLLSYWLVPLLLGSVYHSISFWDPPVKWNSYGAQEVIRMFLNGQLFDFQRLPILTILTVIGFLVCLFRFRGRFRLFSILLPIFLLLYFGRTTWGSLIDLLPQMKEMHQQRLVNGVQLAGVFLIGIGVSWVINTLISTITHGLDSKSKIKNQRSKFWSRTLNNNQSNVSPITYHLLPESKNVSRFAYHVSPTIIMIIIIALLAFPVYRANFLWLKANGDWLNAANKQYTIDEPDFNNLVAKINSLPRGRVYAGRPGNWGRQFLIGQTQMYLALSTRGFWMNGFLPESWSLNSEVETFFNDQNFDNYQLFNVRYIIAPKEMAFPEFAKLIGQFGRFYLYQVETTGFFDLGTSNLLVETKKENITNIHHLWIVSNLPAQKEFPSLLVTLPAGRQEAQPMDLNYTAKIKLLDTNSYERDGQAQSLFSLSYNLKPEPKNLGTVKEFIVEAERNSAEVNVDQNCNECLVVFKTTYHPNWSATIDGKPVKPFMVFPSFMAVRVTPGQHQVEFQYQPAGIKLPLLIIGIGSFILLIVKRKEINQKLSL